VKNPAAQHHYTSQATAIKKKKKPTHITQYHQQNPGFKPNKIQKKHLTREDPA
jgi:hypothetical protein